MEESDSDASDLGNLIIRRKKDESILIDGRIRITVVEVRKRDVRLKVQAPKGTKVLRNELAGEVLPQEPEFQPASISELIAIRRDAAQLESK